MTRRTVVLIMKTMKQIEYLMIGKDVTICCGFYDRDIYGVITVDYTDYRVNCLELSIKDFQLDR